MPPTILLASSSCSRRKIIINSFPLYNILFNSPEIDERSIAKNHRANGNAIELVKAVAAAKADAVIASLDTGIAKITDLNGDPITTIFPPQEPIFVVTADQVAFCDGLILEKPNDAEMCRSYFSLYNETKRVDTVAAIVVTRWNNNNECKQNNYPYVIGTEIATLWWDKIVDKNTIELLIKDGTIFTCCGGFTIESPLLIPFFGKIEGDLDSIKGLPTTLLKNLLKKLDCLEEE